MVGTFLDGVTPTGGFAIQNNSAGIPVVALSADGTTLVRFDSAAPATLAGNAISGIVAGETLVGIDYRPLTGELYGLAVNAAADTGTLYLLPVGGGAATAIGVPGSIAFVSGGGAVDLPAGGYGMDFDPTVDRIRITTESGLNFRIDPTGAPVDGDVIAAGTNPDIAINGLATGASATAYTNSFGQLPGGPTTQYTLDSVSDTLFIQNSSFGTLSAPHAVTLNGSPLDFASVNGFDIPSGVEVAASGSPAFGFGLAALTVAGVTSLYAINLGSGAAIDLGAIGTGAAGLAGLSLGAPPALRSGSAGADSFVAFGGSERIDAGVGIDTVTFGFKLIDATVTLSGQHGRSSTDRRAAIRCSPASRCFELHRRHRAQRRRHPAGRRPVLLFAAITTCGTRMSMPMRISLSFGRHEGRDPSVFFSTVVYRSANPDVAAAGVNPLDSFRRQRLAGRARAVDPLRPGAVSCRQPGRGGGACRSAAALSPVRLPGRAPAVRADRADRRNGFDYVYYLNHNPDVAASGVDPFQHFQTVGWKEGRNPNALFDTNGYLATYADVATATSTRSTTTTSSAGTRDAIRRSASTRPRISRPMPT